ncbi:MAG: WG repeat-containing protein [Pirellula sp.]|nr:WG repeat-containing protein [Pirellula sp.]
METNDNSHWLIRAGIRGRMGLNNLMGKQLVPQIFDWTISGFGWASCSLGDQFVIVDSSGVIIRKVHGVDSYSPISDGMLSITDSSTEKEGYLSIDSSTNDIECNFRTCRNFHRGVAAVEQYVEKQKSRWGFIDKSGEFVIPPIYLHVCDFNDPCDITPYLPYKEMRDDKVWGLINRQGEVVVPPSWSAICEGFFEGHLVAQEPTGEEDGNWGLVDPAGHWAISPVWEALSEHVNDGSIGARKQGRWGVIDLKGNWIVDAKFGFCAAFHEGVARAMIKDKQGQPKRGFIDINGNWIIEPKYDDCEDFRFGLAEVTMYNEQTDTLRTGYVDKSGVEYWEGS